ncbi:MAG TPA: flagellar biosynthetic protein FliO [Phycisphaerales bacterium]|nr:flagellar biosynthetic protein FliO [Phycisphaerales bacterium]
MNTTRQALVSIARVGAAMLLTAVLNGAAIAAEIGAADSGIFGPSIEAPPASSAATSSSDGETVTTTPQSTGPAPEVQAAAAIPPTALPEQERLPLGAAKKPSLVQSPGTAKTSDSPSILDHPVTRTALALALVIALLFGLRAVVRRVSGLSSGLRQQLGAAGKAPSGVLEVLGRYPVSRGQTLVLLRLDRRVVLLSQTTSGFATLSEITDADEVASILTKARDDEDASLSARFNTMLRQIERDPAIASMEEESSPVTPRTAAELPRVGLAGGALPEPADRPLTGAESLRRRLGHLRDMVA